MGLSTTARDGAEICDISWAIWMLLGLPVPTGHPERQLSFGKLVLYEEQALYKPLTKKEQ